MMKKIIGGLLGLTTLALVACGGADAAVEGGREDGVRELRIGLVANNDDPEAGQSSAEFTAALEKALNVRVTEIEGVSHLIGVEAMRSGSLDMMLASGFTYLFGVAVGADLEFVASLHNPDAAFNQTMIVVNAERTDINTLADLEGETFAFVDTASLSGFLNPVYLFVSEFGLDHSRLMMLEPGYFFGQAILSGSHDASMMAVVNGDVAAAAVGSNLIENLVDAGVITESEFRVIYAIEPDPDAGYIVRSDLPQTLVDDLRDFMLNFDDVDFFTNIHNSPNARFVPTVASDFDHIRGLMQTLQVGQGE